MRRAAIMRQQRLRGGARVQEIDLPIPLKGILAEARDAEVSGNFAAELHNIESDGVKLFSRAAHDLSPDKMADKKAAHRIPYEFGQEPGYILTDATGTRWGTARAPRHVAAPFDVAYLSARAVIVDGKGPPVLFDGTEFSLATTQIAGADRAKCDRTGTTMESFDGVVAHHDRTFFWQRGGPLEFFYGRTGEITENEITRFPLDRLGNITGGISEIVSLTMDAGHGMNDVLAIITTTGDMVMYEGFDPGIAEDWRLLSRVKTSVPVGRDGFVNIGGDVWMLSQSGVVSLAESVRRSSVGLVGGVGRPIADDLLVQVNEGGAWQIHKSPDGSMVVLNRVFEGRARQFIYYPLSQSWATADYPAARWHSMGPDLEFTGLDGKLYRIQRRGRGYGGEMQTLRWQSGWFTLRRYSSIKYLRPTILSEGRLTVKVAILTDFDRTADEIVEAQQTVTMEADRPGNAPLSFDEMVAADASGTTYQIRMEVTAPWAQIVKLKAGVA